MASDPPLNAAMPHWWDRMAWLIRGLSLGFLLGYLFSLLVSPADDGTGPIVVVSVSLVVAVLPSLPKAWVEQKNRLRGSRNAALAHDTNPRQNKD